MGLRQPPLLSNATSSWKGQEAMPGLAFSLPVGAKVNKNSWHEACEKVLHGRKKIVLKIQIKNLWSLKWFYVRNRINLWKSSAWYSQNKHKPRKLWYSSYLLGASQVGKEYEQFIEMKMQMPWKHQRMLIFLIREMQTETTGNMIFFTYQAGINPRVWYHRIVRPLWNILWEF